MDKLDWIQWPAMLATIAGAWLTASRSSGRRAVGFWVFLLSNLLWGLWGWSAHAPATVVLQFFLGALNWRGADKNETAPESSSALAD